MNIYIFCIAVIGVLLNAVAQLSIKWGVSNKDSISLEKGISYLIFTTFTNSGIILGLLLYVISVGIWIYVLSKIEVSIAYPLLSIGYVVNLFLAAWLFGESLTLYKFFGIGLIICGVIIMYRGAQA